MEHINVVTAGAVAAKADLHALVQHFPDGGGAGAKVPVGVAAVDHRDPGLLHGLALQLVGPDTVGHEGAVRPEAPLGVGFPVGIAVRAQGKDGFDLRVVFREVRLDGEVVFLYQVPQKVHQLIGAGGGEAGGDHGADVGKTLALLQPAEGLRLGFLGGLAEIVHHAAVHVHLAHVPGDARLFQLLQEYQRGRAVEGGEDAHPGGAPLYQVPCQLGVDAAGEVRVGILGLQGEGIGHQPVHQGHIQSHAQHGVLGGVEVHVGEGLEDQVAGPVFDLRPGVLGRERLIDALDDAVLGHQVAVLQTVQLAQGGGGDDSAL